MTCLEIHRQLLSLATFFWVHSNSKEVSYLSWQSSYPNLKTTFYIKLKFFLRTKLIENLPLAKYLISVATPLIDSEDTWIATSAIHRLNSTGLKILPCGTPKNIGQSVNFLFSVFRYWQRFIRLMQIILMELFND